MTAVVGLSLGLWLAIAFIACFTALLLIVWWDNRSEARKREEARRVVKLERLIRDEQARKEFLEKAQSEGGHS